MAGLGLIERAALTARAAGADPVLLLTDESEQSLGRAAAFTRRARVDDLPALLSEAEAWMLLPARVVADLPSMRCLAAAETGGGVVRLTAQSTGVGPALDLWLAESRHVEAVLAGDVSRGCAVRDVDPPEGSVAITVRGEADLPDAETRLLRSQSSDTDGWVDRVFNRHISRAFSRMALRTPITPNGVTWLHICLGLFACALFATGSYLQGVLGAVLLQLSVALDCADGEIARLKLQFSRWGGTLDVMGDNVVHAAVFAAIGLAAQRQFGVRKAMALGASAVAGIVMAAAVVGLLTVWQRKRWEAGKPAGYALAPVAANHALAEEASAPPPNARLDAFINQLTSRDFSVLIAAAALCGHLEWMLWMAAVGAHVFWIGFLLLQLWMFRGAYAEAA